MACQGGVVNVTRRAFTWRLAFSALVMLVTLAMLAWEHFNGGVKTHHLMQSAAMPSISNVWNLLLLPAIAWFLSGRIERRITRPHMRHSSGIEKISPTIAAGFVGALLVGSLLSIFFAFGNEDITAVIFFGMLLTALVLPVYRAEYVLGFVLSMTFIFGAFIPLAIGSIIAVIAATIQRLIYPLLARAWRYIKNKRK